MQLRQLLAAAATGVLGGACLAVPAHAERTPAHARHGHRKARPGRGRGRVELIIPRLRFDDAVSDGISEADLKHGVGHYPGTAFPGQVGNAVYLGHRTTGRAPFDDLQRLRTGDRVVLVSGRREYVYRVAGSKIILPTDSKVLAPVPMRPGRPATERWATLITCYPRGLDSHRFVVFTHFVHKRRARHAAVHAHGHPSNGGVIVHKTPAQPHVPPTPKAPSRPHALPRPTAPSQPQVVPRPALPPQPQVLPQPTVAAQPQPTVPAQPQPTVPSQGQVVPTQGMPLQPRMAPFDYPERGDSHDFDE
ncbi:sortase [Spirillospora sp. NPDC052269]